MKQLLLALCISFFAACGGGGNSTTSQAPTGQSNKLVALMGKYSSASGEYRIKIAQEYSTRSLFGNGDVIFYQMSSISMSLKNDATGEIFPFHLVSMTNIPDPNPPKGSANLSWSLVTANFVVTPKPPAGIYTLHTLEEYYQAGGIRTGYSTYYTIE